VTNLTVGMADRIHRETTDAQRVRGVGTVKPVETHNSGQGVSECP